jgi:hypothetical protein
MPQIFQYENLAILLNLISIFFHYSCKPEVQVNVNTTEPSESEITYDSILAQKTGADDYGMKHYVMAFLKAGPNRDQDSVYRCTDSESSYG